MQGSEQIMSNQLIGGAPLGVLFAALMVGAPSWAVNKCTGPDGKVSFQDAPCAGKGEALTVRPSGGDAPAPGSAAASKAQAEVAAIHRRADIRAAIERREPMVGMTTAELEEAMGQPDRSNFANYNGKQHNQLIYERGERTLYVYTDGGHVIGFQDAESVGRSRRSAQRCLSATEIRALETSASSITLGAAERSERLRQIGEAKRCGQ
jgi:hypothetical protein